MGVCHNLPFVHLAPTLATNLPAPLRDRRLRDN